MAGSAHLVGGLGVGKGAVDLSVPEAELLADVAEVGRRSPFGQLQTHDAEVETMGVGAIPVGGTLLAARLLELAGIHLLMTATEVELLQILLYLIVVGVVETVPSPLALGAKGHTFLIKVGEGLQTGGIDGEGELTVAHRERGQRVEGRDMRMVSCHQGLTVDGRGLLGSTSGQHQGQQRK